MWGIQLSGRMSQMPPPTPRQCWKDERRSFAVAPSGRTGPERATPVFCWELWYVATHDLVDWIEVVEKPCGERIARQRPLHVETGCMRWGLGRDRKPCLDLVTQRRRQATMSVQGPPRHCHLYSQRDRHAGVAAINRLMGVISQGNEGPGHGTVTERQAQGGQDHSVIRRGDESRRLPR